MVMKNVVDKLRGGERRSIGQANEVAKEISGDRKKFAQVFAAMTDEDAVVRMRAADAMEKASAAIPELLQLFAREMLHKVAAVEQQEVRWHVAQMLPRLRLKPRDRGLAVAILLEYLEDRSSIVRTFAIQGLADFAVQDERLRARVIPILEKLTSTGSPAMRARGRKLLKTLQR
jgi:hypothetical protein